jgi:large subunit ribosomal protein L15
MTTRFRKKEKGRGAGTGYGSKKKHRGKGSRGGRGYAGLHKHKWSWIVSKAPDHYGYKGFTSKRQRILAINVGDIEKISEGKSEIDLSKMGYGKLLSRGHMLRPVSIRVDACTQRAKAKIEKAGGKIIQPTDKQ